MRTYKIGAALAFAALSLASWAEPIRDYYEEPGINPFKSFDNQDFSETVDPFSGMLQVGITDLYLPGNGGFDVEIRRTYATSYVTTSERTPYGYGWVLHFGRIVTATDNNDKICSQALWATSATDNPSLELPDGSRKLLVLADNHSTDLITKDYWSAKCVSGDVYVWSPDGTEYRMTHALNDGDIYSLYATYIEDANGNSLSINYATNPSGFAYIDNLATSDGRSVEFTYADENNGDIRLTQIEANNQTWNYQYTFPAGVLQPPPQLETIERPDGTEWAFSYYPTQSSGNAGSLALEQITTPMGGTIAYTYDFVHFAPGQPAVPTTVVDSRTTGGTDVTTATRTYSYTAGFNSSTGYDETVVTHPDRIKKYYHFGYSSVGAGTVWRTGLLKAEELYDSSGAIQERITHTYGRQTLSNENFWHGRDTGRVDSATYVPIRQETDHYKEGRGATTTYANFDAYGQPQTITETPTITSYADRVTTLVYDNKPSNWIIGLVAEETVDLPTSAPTDSWTTSRTFDANGNLLTESQYGITTTYTYTAEGDVATVTDANNNTTTLSDYHRGIAREEQQPEGVTLTRTVNNTGTLASETDGRGYTTHYTWDDLNRLTGIDYPVNADVSFAYTANERVTTRGTFKKTVTWDGFGRKMDVTTEDTSTLEAVTVTRSRDSTGRVTFVSYPNSSDGVTTTFDEFDRKLSESHTNGDTVTYDHPSPSELTITDENGHVTQKVFAHFGSLSGEGWVTQILSPESIATLITRNGLGQTWRVFQGELLADGQVQGFARIYNHDSRSLLTSEEHPETGTTRYTYDAVGNMLTKQVGTGGVVESFTYDDRDRLTAKSYSDTTPSVTYAYDLSDNRVSVTNASAARSYTYDENGNLTEESLTVGTNNYNLVYGINALGHVDSLTYPSGSVVNVAPDALGRQRSATPYVTDVQYHAVGIPQSVTLNNGVDTSITLDARQRPDGIVTANGATALVDLAYGYDNSLNVNTMTDNLSSLHDRTMTYDGMDRLETVTGGWGTESVTYNALGNITIRDRAGTTQEYYYNNMKLTHRVFPSYYLAVSHDARGNVTDDGVNQYT